VNVQVKDVVFCQNSGRLNSCIDKLRSEWQGGFRHFDEGHWPAGGKAQATPNRTIWSTKQNSLNEEVR